MYEIFEQLLQKNGITSYKVSKETGIAQSVFSSWKNGVSKPKQDKLMKIANYFDVTLDFLMGKTDIVVCPICGFGNDPLSEQSVKEHKEFHNKFLKAKDKFPFLTNYSDSQTKILNAVRENKIKADDEKYAEIIKNYIDAQYSLELQKCGYNVETYTLQPYDAFCSKELRDIAFDTNGRKTFKDNVYDYLKDKYNIKRIDQNDMVKESHGYYLNDETARIAQEIYDRDDLKILMDASRKAKPEDIKFLIEMAKRLKGEN